MASNLACVGLAVANNDSLASLVAAVLPVAMPLGRVGGTEILRWEDESSGARLLLGIESGNVVDMLPSLASRAGTHLADLRLANDAVATAAVLDESGEQVTSLALEIEQRRLLGTRVLENAQAAIVALGQAVSVHANADAFAASTASLLDPNADGASEPPSHFVERGWKWPPRMAPEAFFSYGVFGDAAAATARARLSGVVLTAESRTTAQTEQSFIVARVRTAGFEADVCLSIHEHPFAPAAGEIISGSVFLVGSVPSLEPPIGSKRWWRRSRN